MGFGGSALGGYSRVLVTGGAGFIGSHLVERLLRTGHEVCVLDNFSHGQLQNLQRSFGNERFHLITGDLRSSGDIEAAIRGADAVCHLGAIVSVSVSHQHPSLVDDVNVKGTQRLLEACVQGGVKTFVYASSCAVYGEAQYLPIDESHPTKPISPYAASKLAAETQCVVFHEAYGLRTLCLRYFNVYGPRQAGGPYGGVITRFIERLKQGTPPPIYGDGEQTRDFVYVDDVVTANLLALEHRSGGEAINIGTGTPTTVNALARVLLDLMGCGDVTPEYLSPRAGDIRRSYANIGKAQRLLSYVPTITLKDGLRTLLEG